MLDPTASTCTGAAHDARPSPDRSRFVMGAFVSRLIREKGMSKRLYNFLVISHLDDDWVGAQELRAEVRGLPADEPYKQRLLADFDDLLERRYMTLDEWTDATRSGDAETEDELYAYLAEFRASL
jgi:hypothetical protein